MVDCGGRFLVQILDGKIMERFWKGVVHKCAGVVGAICHSFFI